jgi:hypothetical protein
MLLLLVLLVTCLVRVLGNFSSVRQRVWTRWAPSTSWHVSLTTRTPERCVDGLPGTRTQRADKCSILRAPSRCCSTAS